MSKTLIASVVGGLILFIWQFLSWSMLNLHGSQLTYTPDQEKILQTLGEHLDEGSYFLPTVAPGAPAADREKLQAEAIGKPWAQIKYHKAFSMNMTSNMLRGFLVNVVSVFLMCWILMKIPDLDFMTVLLSSLAVGFTGYLTISYINHVWFETNSLPELIDTVAQWGICGLFLGWFLTRKPA